MKTGIDKLRYGLATLAVIMVLVFQAGEANSNHHRPIKKLPPQSVYQKMRQKMMRFGFFGNQILLGEARQK
ncbi:MAG TPA: hypothetical protein PK509_08930 [Catalimonadaceae bacterium]|nr:hypothetical protein [Catalimonadaceae bacterium]HPI11323.1 hypothetical protein [Catalimonadaceae bacterium]